MASLVEPTHHECVTTDLLRRLAGLRAERGRVLSVYVDLDPSRFGTRPARAHALRSAADEAARRAGELHGLGHAEREALRLDAAQLDEVFASLGDDELAPGLAVFAGRTANLLEVVHLPEPLPAAVAIEGGPAITPLARLRPPERWAVLLVSRADGRLLRGSQYALDRDVALDDDVHGQHDQGGLSQPNYQRSVDEEARRHIARVLDTVRRSDERQPLDHLLIGAQEEVTNALDRLLPDRLRGRVRGRIASEPHAPAAQVLEDARPAMIATEQKCERALLDRLADARGMGSRASDALPAVLDGLVQGRVATLFLDAGFTAPGRCCPTCGWLGVDGDRCPLEGTELERFEDITETVVRSALRQSADVVVPRHHDDLARLGGIASLDRF